jgi:hypothetical protein
MRRIDSADGIEIVARVPRPTRLHVRDAKSRQELSNVEIVTSEWDREGEHPGAVESRVVLGSGLASPLDVDALLGDRERDPTVRILYVHVPGYAWSSVRFDYAAGGERELLLSAGGDLEVNLVGRDHAASVRLHVRREGQIEDVSRAPATADRIRFESLPPGSFELVATVGEARHRDEVVVGRVQAIVRAGETSTVDLALDPVPIVKAVSAAGEFALPLAWGLKPRCFGFTLVLIDPPRDGRSRTRVLYGTTGETPVNGQWVYAWSADDLQPGRYKVEVSTPPFKAAFDLPETGIGEPAEVAVRVVAAETNEDAAVETVNWTPIRDGVRDGRLQGAEYDRAARVYRIRCAVGRIYVSASDSRFSYSHTELEVGSAGAEAKIAVTLATGLRIALLDGETPVPMPPYWTPTLQDGQGKATRCGMRVDGSARIFYVEKGGPTTVKFSDLPGFEALPDRTIQLEDGRIAEVTIALARTP